jgi:acyl-CoA thioester hydrolase
VIEHYERIRWSDVDSYGHVNNAVYLNYLEEARDRWFRDVMGEAFGFVLVRVAIDFRTELSLEDGEVVISCAGTGFGTSSVRTREEVRTRDGRLAAESASVSVKHDEVSRTSVPLTQEERALLEAAVAADA